MPWVSLAMGVASAVLMDRSPRRAGLIGAAALAGWGLLVALVLLDRVREDGLSERRRLAVRAARFLSEVASGWAVQLAVFFSFPFYALASPGRPGHFLFLAAVGGVGALTLWDPLFQRQLRHPLRGPALQSVACFCALNVVLPILGASNRVGLWGAALSTAVALPAAAAVLSPAPRLRAAIVAGAVGLVAPLSLLAGSAALVPAAPLRLLSQGLGSRLEGSQVADPTAQWVQAPGQLVCGSVVWAPRGLRDELFHVWRRDGAPTDRIALEVRGGRAQGFHTWSVKRSLGPGDWTCTVETASGQVLGEQRTRLLAGRASDAGPS